MNVLLMCPSKYDAQINSRPCLSRSLFLSPPINLSTSLILRHHYIHNQIVQINGQDVRGLEMNQVLGLIKGAPGTMVTLTVMQPSLKSHVCGNELYFPSPSVIARMDIGRSSMGGAVLALCTINRDAVNNIGVSFERDSNGVHVARSLFPG